MICSKNTANKPGPATRRKHGRIDPQKVPPNTKDKNQGPGTRSGHGSPRTDQSPPRPSKP